MIFENNMELDRQGMYNAPDKVKGFSKAALGVLGYKDTGESNAWGKFLNVMPGVGTIGRNVLAGTLSKGTDTNTAIKGQRDEAFNDSMQGLDFGLKALSLAGGINAAGGLGKMLGVGPGAQLINKMKDQATLDATKAALDADLENLNTDEILSKAQQMEGDASTDFDNYTTMPLANQQKQRKTFFEQGGAYDKINRVLGVAGVFGDMAGTIGNNLVSGIATNKAGEQEWDTLKRNSVSKSTFNYL
jgi:hypothetical protein